MRTRTPTNGNSTLHVQRTAMTTTKFYSKEAVWKPSFGHQSLSINQKRKEERGGFRRGRHKGRVRRVVAEMAILAHRWPLEPRPWDQRLSLSSSRGLHGHGSRCSRKWILCNRCPVGAIRRPITSRRGAK